MFSQTNLVKLDHCLACGSSDLDPLLDLGLQPLANSYKNSPDAPEEKYPLATNRCKHCDHVQLTHIVNPDLMFKDYAYVSGTSETMKQHFKWFAEYTDEMHFLFGNHAVNVLDIGCNDGSQLDQFRELSYQTFGVDPAENLFETSSKNHSIHLGYFDDDYCDKLDIRYDTIIAQNVFAHNYDPLAFLLNAKRCLKWQGLLFIQTSQADMILNGEFDTIYHEHLSFFNVKSMNELCKRAKLNLIDVIKCPLHGNSFIFVISKGKKREANMANILAMEEKAGLHDESAYKLFVYRFEETVKMFNFIVRSYREMGHVIAGYGAAAKAMTFLNAATEKLDFIIDDNPLKQNKFAPGVNTPIYSSEHLKSNTNKDILWIPLAWNFHEEIVAKIKKLSPDTNNHFYRYFRKEVE